MNASHQDINLLIDAIVQQNVVLIAHLATLGGQRAPLAHIANQVFLGLIEELQRQGVNQKVTADMFGLALRTYQRKRQRLLESATEEGRSLWEAILKHIEAQGACTRAQLMERFPRDEENLIRGVLTDLVDNNLLIRQGQGSWTQYRPTTADERARRSPWEAQDAVANMVWIAVYKGAPVTLQALLQEFGHIKSELLKESLQHLLTEGRIQESPLCDGTQAYTCGNYVIPVGSRTGWAAAVFDHYQAMVGALCAKLQQNTSTSAHQDVIGGSTFAFDFEAGHPLEEEVYGLLNEFRQRAQKLRQRVDALNDPLQNPATMSRRVLLYIGQNVIADDDDTQGHP